VFFIFTAKCNYSLAKQEKGRDWVARRSSPKVTRVPILESNTSSKDKYIARLEAELRGFRGDTAIASSSKAVMPYESPLRRRDDNNGGSVQSATIVQFN